MFGCVSCPPIHNIAPQFQKWNSCSQLVQFSFLTSALFCVNVSADQIVGRAVSNVTRFCVIDGSDGIGVSSAVLSLPLIRHDLREFYVRSVIDSSVEFQSSEDTLASVFPRKSVPF